MITYRKEISLKTKLFREKKELWRVNNVSQPLILPLTKSLKIVVFHLLKLSYDTQKRTIQIHCVITESIYLVDFKTDCTPI